MAYKFVGRLNPDGTPAEVLNGVPPRDLSNADVEQLAAERRWTLEETVALLDASSAYQRTGGKGLDVDAKAAKQVPPLPVAAPNLPEEGKRT